MVTPLGPYFGNSGLHIWLGNTNCSTNLNIGCSASGLDPKTGLLGVNQFTTTEVETYQVTFA